MYKKMMIMLCLTESLFAMQSDNGQMPPFADEQEVHLNQSVNELWDLLARFTYDRNIPTQQELDQSGKRYEQAYQAFMARHKKTS